MIYSSIKTTIDALDRHVNFICKQSYCYATSDIALMMSSIHCTNMYCCQLWFNSTKSSLIKLCSVCTSFNSVLRRLLCISKPYIASNMFVPRGIPSFDELWRKSVYRFKNRIELSSNSIITLIYISSPIRK